MADPFIGEIKLVSFDFAPKGWAFCDGTLLNVAQNSALFALLGTTFGGNGATTFGLPDLRGRAPVGWGGGNTLGQAGGETAHLLTPAEMPTHVHIANGSSAAASTPLPGGTVMANPGLNAYAVPNPAQPIAPGTIGRVGGSQAHENMSPYLVLNFVIALLGVFPTRN